MLYELLMCRNFEQDMSYAIMYRMGGILLKKFNELLLKNNKVAMT